MSKVIKDQKAHKFVVHPKTIAKPQGFNDRLAVWISSHVGSMYCAWLFGVIGISGVYFALTGNAKMTLVVGSISGYFLQLVLLPIIMVAQNVAQAASDAKATVDHQTLTYLATIQDEQLQILEYLRGKK